MIRAPWPLRLAAAAALLAASTACDYTGDFLFPAPVENVPAILHMLAEDGSEMLVPVAAADLAELQAATIYGEVGPTGTPDFGGTTFTFLGDGGPVCVLVDPETTSWSWSISPNPNEQQKIWNYPDNVFDDGDIDLFVGQSVYYTGSPGVAIGDFEIEFTDPLGNPVPLELSLCTNLGIRGQVNAHAGRGAPELCDIAYTDPGVSYTGLLQTFSTPLDDDRLAFGLIVYDGTCASLLQLATGVSPSTQADSPAAAECAVMGESLIPRPINEGDLTYCTGAGCIDPWPGSMEFETEFCKGALSDMRKFCRNEADAKFTAGVECQRETVVDLDARCFCGDINDLPVPGAL